MEVAQLKELLGTIATLLFVVFCVIGVTGAYIVGAYKASILNDRLKEQQAAMEKALSILNDQYQALAHHKTIIVERDTDGKVILRALNTAPEEELRK